MSEPTTETATAASSPSLDVGAMLDQIEAILRAIANRPRKTDGESVNWTVKCGYSGGVVAEAQMLDMHNKPIDRASISASLRGENGYPPHAEIVRALHAVAVKRAKEYAKAISAAVGE